MAGSVRVVPVEQPVDAVPFLEALSASLPRQLYSVDIACVVEVIHVAKRQAAVEPVVPVVERFSEHLLLAGGRGDAAGDQVTYASAHVILAVARMLCSSAVRFL